MRAEHFGLAQTMAQTWVRQHTDPNEIAKSLRYLRDHVDGAQFFRYLSTVVKDGRAVVRSGRTLDYYRQIEQVCQQHLGRYQDDPATMALILGWAVRLMRFYAVESDLSPLAPLAPPVQARDRPAPSPPTDRPRRLQDVKVGMVLAGQVRRIMPYGAFVDMGIGRDGLIHISELADRRVGRVEDVVTVGQEVTVRVISVDLPKRRISLSLKGV